jgi:uncharacterized protein (TIGR02147 family)
MTPQVYDFVDYREFLSEWFRAKKAMDSKVSYRYLAKQLSLRSPNHFHLVVHKKRHLSKTTVKALHRFLKLKPKERYYFDILFEAATTRSAQQREQLESRIRSLQQSLTQSETPAEQYQVLSNLAAWMIKIGAYQFNGKTTAQLLTHAKTSCKFPITDGDVKAALKTLEQSGFASQDGDVWQFDLANIRTGWDLDHQQIKQFHTNNLRLAQQSVAWPVQQRYFSNVTFAANEELIEFAKAQIRDLCLRILERSNTHVQSETSCKEVVSLQFAMFPFFHF